MLFEKEINEIKDKIEKNCTKKEICAGCPLRISNVMFCFRCPANKIK